jgi:serine phosphatase RsbU (regulator of sigma subunit)
MADESPLASGWLTDRIVTFAPESDPRQRDDSPFRLNAETPYLRLHFVNVYVRDQERSLRFFVDKLGFTLVADVRFASGRRWVEVSPPDGTAILALVLPIEGLDQEKFVGRSGLVTFLAEDIDRTYREWSERGVHFTIPPQTPAWGGTFCHFVDPDGNSFSLAGFTEVTRSIDERRRAYAAKLESERRTAQELEIARQVQARLFPQIHPQVAGLEYAGICVQARSVGGDYYDFLAHGNGHLALIVGDIAGKGIAAALLMANLQANLRTQFTGAADDPQRLLASVNRLLFDNTAPTAYATLFYADYDSAHGRLTYANCGHVAGLVLRVDGSINPLDSNCTVLGLFENWEGHLSSTELQLGDLLVLYTDGVTECENSKEEEFGQHRLVESIRRHQSLLPEALAAAVSHDVLAYGEERQFDDLTLIVARRA